MQQTKVDSLGRLAAGLAHDFNNLLTVVMGQVNLLSACATSPKAEAAKRSLDAALRQATELTQSMLVYARKQPEQRRQTELDGVVREAAPLIAALADGLHVTTSLNARDAQVWIDPTRLRQVLLNLTGNAADATRGHGHSVHVSTHVELVDAARARRGGAAPAGEFAVLTVADDGLGMDAHTLARIFDPFFTTKDEGRGTGLGIPICQSIVQRSGGFLEVQSQPGEGAIFRVFLPLVERPADRQTVRATESGIAPAPARGPLQVLVVQQGQEEKTLVSALRAAGYVVLVAHGMRSAAQHIACNALDVMLVQGEMEHDVDRVLARSARSLHPELRAVLMADGADADALERGFDAVLSRPVDPARVLEVLERLGRGPSRHGARAPGKQGQE
jgi:hypothetical protein